MNSYQTDSAKKAADKQGFSQDVTETYNDIEKNTLPGAIQSQNVGHNSKKEGLGPNTKR